MLSSSKKSETPAAPTAEVSNLPVNRETTDMNSLAKQSVNCTNSIVISDIKIHKDAEGRYSLNDLHKAAGKEHRHLPNYWFELQQAKELIEEILNTGFPVIKNPVDSKKGRYGGTYVCKELVYSYAMWISAAFALKVIRAYDALVTGDVNEAVRIARTTVNERTPLRDAVNMLVGKKGLRYDDAYNMVHQRFNIDSIDELELEQIPLAVEYVHRMALEGEFLGKQLELPKPELDINFPLSWFAENSGYIGCKNMRVGDRVMVTIDVLKESPSPSLRLITLLKEHGYDVTAPYMELKALQHMLTEMRWALENIGRFTGKRDNAALSFKI